MSRRLLFVIFWTAFAALVVVSFVLTVNGAVLALAVIAVLSGAVLYKTRPGAR